ncbi:MAG: hypothetical protein ACR2IP_08440 [Solirubrobacteraceae bacterium]
MKELHGAATGATTVSPRECTRFLRAADRYPVWCPEVVREVEVLERNGEGDPARVRALLHMARGPLVKDFHVVLEIAVELGSTVELTRVPEDASDRERLEMIWRVGPGAASVSGGPGEAEPTRISLELEASLSVPRLLPLAGIGDDVAQSLCGAAVRALDAPSP